MMVIYIYIGQSCEVYIYIYAFRRFGCVSSMNLLSQVLIEKVGLLIRVYRSVAVLQIYQMRVTLLT